MNWYKQAQQNDSTPLYHGTTNQEQFSGGKFVVPDKSGKDGIGWLTDDKDYAYQQGEIHEVSLNGSKPLTTENIGNVSENEIFSAIKKIKNDIDENFFYTKLYPHIAENIVKYQNEEISSENIFSGMGGVSILKTLGFTHEVILNPYDQSGQTHFFKIFDGNSVVLV